MQIISPLCFYCTTAGRVLQTGRRNRPGKLESITIGAQTDGLLRVTLDASGEVASTVTLFLAPEANE